MKFQVTGSTMIRKAKVYDTTSSNIPCLEGHSNSRTRCFWNCPRAMGTVIQAISRNKALRTKSRNVLFNEPQTILLNCKVWDGFDISLKSKIADKQGGHLVFPSTFCTLTPTSQHTVLEKENKKVHVSWDKHKICAGPLFTHFTGAKLGSKRDTMWCWLKRGTLHLE